MFIAKELQIYMYPYAYVRIYIYIYICMSCIQGGHSTLQFERTSEGHLVQPQSRVNIELRPVCNIPCAFHWQGCQKVDKDSSPASALNFAFPTTVCVV